LSPKPGDYVRVYKGSGSDSDYSDEPLEEVNLSASKWGSYARYTVYRITDADKRILNDTVAPVFQKQVHGAGEWSAITPSEIWYGAGYIVLSAALNNDDLVRCHSGHYLTPTEFFGCATRTFTDKTNTQECTCYGDTSIERAPTTDDWDGKIEAFSAKKCAEATSSGGASNRHIRGIHRTGGAAGNSITYDLQDNDAAALAVSVIGNAITVDLDTAAGSPISTATEVIAALNADADVQALGVHFELPSGEDGSGVVADSGPYTLSGGSDAIDFSAMKGTRHAFRFYGDYANGDMHVGFGFVSEVDWTGGPSDLLKAGLSIQGHGYPIKHVRE